ncbi:MAG: hypothetical protein NZ551_08630 [Microscillaceae bacterium]|nr:hypothetical protein [Microscillaceae bacterium]MDW8461265.1 hypothetical protein [Cytophagales bacterium]
MLKHNFNRSIVIRDFLEKISKFSDKSPVSDSQSSIYPFHVFGTNLTQADDFPC